MNRDLVADDLKRDEGWRPSAYQDTEGYLTIGYGFLIDDRKNGQMPKSVGEFWLQHNLDMLERSLRAALPNWDQYPAGIQRAFANMAYQLGIGGLLQFRHTIALVDERKYVEAAVEALDSRWAHQTPNRARRVTQWIRDAGEQ